MSADNAVSERASEPCGQRIALLLPNLHPGGAERVVLRLSETFLERGLGVDLVLRQRQGALLDAVPEGVRLISLDARRVRDAVGPLRRYFRAERPSAAIASLWPLTSLAVWARLLSGVSTRVATLDHGVLSLSGPGRPGLRRLAMRAAMRASYPVADAVIGVSRGVADDVARLAGLAPCEVRVIHNPITPLRPASPLDPAGLPPETLGWRAFPGPKIVTAGVLKPVKDHLTLLEAFARLVERQDARLLILGEGTERPRIEARRAALGLVDKVAMPGFVPQPHAYFAEADAFALSSRSEGFGNVLVEALACGLPVVSTDCPSGPREILDNGRWGRLVPVGNPVALTDALHAALGAPREPDALKARSADFSADRAADAFLSLLGAGGSSDPPGLVAPHSSTS